MTDEILIRQLLWQNGLYRGLLAMTAKSLAGEIDAGECRKLAEEAQRVLVAPLPPFLRPDEKNADPNDCPF